MTTNSQPNTEFYRPERFALATCLHKALAHARDTDRLTVSELARRTGLCQRTIHNYLSGATEPLVSDAMKIARALGMTVEECFANK